MRITPKATWTEWEVSKILRDSERASVAEGERGTGHAESRHELQAIGKRRENTTKLALEERVLGKKPDGLTEEEQRRYRPPETAGAFNGCQVRAIVLALNSQAGQNALRHLLAERVEHVVAKIDISVGTFPMYEVDATDSSLEPLPPGVTMVASQYGFVARGMPARRSTVACGINLKLMKDAALNLHIRTAYPYAKPIGQETATLRYVAGVIDHQEVPI